MSARSHDSIAWSHVDTDAGATGPLQRIVNAVFAWYRRRQITAELMALDEHMLADIGITRADIPAIANDTFLPQNWAARGQQPAFLRVAANSTSTHSGIAA